MLFARLIAALSVCVWIATGQAPTTSGRLIGEVTSIEADGQKMRLRTDAGGEIDVVLSDKAVFLRVPPGEKDLKRASRIKLADISPGDRVLARGEVSDGGSRIVATAIVAMSKAEIAEMHERDRAEWQKRGTAGRVTSVDAAARRMTLAPGRPGAQPATIEWTDKTAFRRYAPGSVRFSDARPGPASDIQPGDQVRVLGDKDESSGVIRAEQIVSGAFRQTAGAVTSVDAAKGEVRITDLATKKPLVIRVNSDTTLKKLPPEVAAMMARRVAAPAQGSASREAAAADRARIPRPARREPDLQQAMEQWPSFTVGELQPGEALIVSATGGPDPQSVTAVVLIAGAEPLLRASPERATEFGGWNFGEIGPPE